MRPSLPVEGISLILGNDLVGKRVMVNPRVVEKPRDYEKPFKLIIDSSDVGTGTVLVQEASDGLGHPGSYFSKKCLKYQKIYSVVEKETLGLVLALEHLMFICVQHHSKSKYTLIIIL